MSCSHRRSSLFAIAIAICFVTGLLGPDSAVHGAIVDLTASQDNTLFQDDAGTLSNGSGQYLFAGTTQSGEIRRGLIAFDLSSIPADSKINLASLRLEMNRTISPGRDVSLHRVTSDWGESASNAGSQEGRGAPAEPGDATWIHTFSAEQLWQTPGGDFIATPSATLSVSGNGQYTWPGPELAADVQRWLDDPSSNFGWALVGDEGRGGTAKRFASRESAERSREASLDGRFHRGN